MGRIFGNGTDLAQVEGERMVWSNTRRPALLVPEAAVTLANFDLAYPNLAVNNAYGFVFDTNANTSSCVSFVTIVPQEWDSGLSFVCDLPAKANYFEIEMAMSRVVTPSTFLGQPILAGYSALGQHMPDGNAAVIEGVGPIRRMFAFERVGNAVYLRLKQSVANEGPVVGWNPSNSTTFPGGGKRPGWTHGGNPNGWPAYAIQSKGTGDINKNRGESNACSLANPTNYASTWRGTVTITPGYIQL